MSSNITFFSNNTTIPAREVNEIIVDDHMILIVDGVKFTKQRIKDNAIDLQLLKNKLRKIQGEHNVTGNNESTN